MVSLSQRAEYQSLAANLDGEAFEGRDSPPSHEKLEHYNDEVSPSKWSFILPKPLVYACLVVAILSAINAALFPLTVIAHREKPLTDEEMVALPWPDQRLGIDRVAKPPPPVWNRSWPSKIVRLTGKAKRTAYGDGKQVFLSPTETTLMHFSVPPSHSAGNACAISLSIPPDLSPRIKDLRTKGDVSEIEVWSVVQPVDEEIVWDSLTWNKHPPRGELLGTVCAVPKPAPMMEKRNSTTVDFACPEKDLVVELRCMKPGCEVQFKQLHIHPKLAFELVRRAH
ncbi:hypothetical protein BDN72DRAFT_839796 [Pluteus cervinus]|uniref:Uncharacterized protein n=1 Tax=Pluteus cervinus TaxID=181527 RepID=A0ACD3AVU4_9AGAR|nr:hypothetical protein BDN72DRAFT_839796 [Pluteus cervinus]